MENKSKIFGGCTILFLGIDFIYNIITTLTCKRVYLLSVKLVVYQRRIGMYKVDYRAVVTLLDDDPESYLCRHT
jgi:hypothetical protein